MGFRQKKGRFRPVPLAIPDVRFFFQKIIDKKIKNSIPEMQKKIEFFIFLLFLEI